MKLVRFLQLSSIEGGLRDNEQQCAEIYESPAKNILEF